VRLWVRLWLRLRLRLRLRFWLRLREDVDARRWTFFFGRPAFTPLSLVGPTVPSGTIK